MAWRLAAPNHGEVEAPLWRAMLAAPEPMSVSELHHAVQAHPNAIAHRLHRWERAGLVCRQGAQPVRFSLTDNARAANDDQRCPPQVRIDGATQPRQRSQRARLWSAIRVLRRFNLPELLITSGATRRSAEDMINCLQRAGYLACESRGSAMNGSWSTYRLTHRVGPRVPRITRRDLGFGLRRYLIDPNSGDSIDISPGAPGAALHKAAPGAALNRAAPGAARPLSGQSVIGGEG